MFPNTDKMHYRAMQNPSGTDAHSNCVYFIFCTPYLLMSHTNNKPPPPKKRLRSPEIMWAILVKNHALKIFKIYG